MCGRGYETSFYLGNGNPNSLLSHFQVCVTFVFSALLEYALVNYASRSDAQRLAKKKHQKQWELDQLQAFDPASAASGPPPPDI